MQEITSSQNPKLKQAVRLHSSRGRKQQDRIVIFGWRELKRAFDLSVEVEEVFVCPKLAGDLVADVVTAAEASHTAVYSVSPDVFEKLKYGDRSDGVVATAKRPDMEIDAATLNDDPFFVVLQGIEKPGNLGAILRTADGAGVSGVIVVDAVTDVFHPNSIRSSMGTVFSIPVLMQTSMEAIRWLKEHSIQIVVTRPDAESEFFDLDLTGAVAIVLGSESEGLSSEWNDPAMSSTSLPMLGVADSLNVSVTTGVVVYEARRQKMFQKKK